jgi:hypothetical protein
MIEIWRDSGGQEPVKFEILEESQFGNLDEAMIFMNKALEVTKKPSQRRYLKSPGSRCELVADL